MIGFWKNRGTLSEASADYHVWYEMHLVGIVILGPKNRVLIAFSIIESILLHCGFLFN
jgi:hypothetical protein